MSLGYLFRLGQMGSGSQDSHRLSHLEPVLKSFISLLDALSNVHKALMRVNGESWDMEGVFVLYLENMKRHVTVITVKRISQCLSIMVILDSRGVQLYGVGSGARDHNTTPSRS